jgi:hypothetical protein
MVFIRYNLVSEDKGTVTYLHNFPEDLSQDMLNTGVLVNSIPESQIVEGKIAVLCYSPLSQSIFYDYQDKLLTTEEEVNQLKQQNAQMLLALVEGGLM